MKEWTKKGILNKRRKKGEKEARKQKRKQGTNEYTYE